MLNPNPSSVEISWLMVSFFPLLTVEYETSTEQPLTVLSELTLALTKVVSWQASKPFMLT